jgi:hypothetical protein
VTRGLQPRLRRNSARPPPSANSACPPSKPKRPDSNTWCPSAIPAQAPDGTIVLYMIGGGDSPPSSIVNCTANRSAKNAAHGNHNNDHSNNGSEAHNDDDGDDNFTSSIFVTWAPSVYGPWQPAPVPVVFADGSPELGYGRYNPSPHFLDNGSVLLAFQVRSLMLLVLATSTPPSTPTPGTSTRKICGRSSSTNGRAVLMACQASSRLANGGGTSLPAALLRLRLPPLAQGQPQRHVWRVPRHFCVAPARSAASHIGVVIVVVVTVVVIRGASCVGGSVPPSQRCVRCRSTSACV